MNLSEYAKQMGTSRTTLYRKINEAKIDVEAIRLPNGEISDEGLSILSALFDGTPRERKPSQEDYASQDVVTLMEQVTDLKRQLDATKKELSEAEARNRELGRQLTEQSQRYADTLLDVLKRQQDLEQQRLLTTRDDRGFFERLFGRRKQKNGSQGNLEGDKA